VATATAFDNEMQARIDAHKAERDGRWTTIEAAIALPETIGTHAAPDRVLLVDCLTLWLNNLMFAEKGVGDATDALCEALRDADGPVILVSNEIGLGLVPETPLGRRFRDAQGRLNQRVAEVADRVTFVAAGLPLQLKPAR
jgi:adenosylcobinamide kinase/adenosylcobinamide-phosphate guanylyltransferase